MEARLDIKKYFLDYFVKNNHKLIESSPLLPYNDSSIMFTNSGMVQFKDIFLGNKKVDYNRAVTSQKCLRAGGKHNDLENVGYTKRHHTFFEMLGNFSFFDYFKEEAIFYAYDFIVNVLKINKNKLVITVFYEDVEAFNLWKKLGFLDNQIIKISSKDNFWSMGDLGPCGPCTEIFYDHGASVFGGLPGTVDENGDRFVEIWNVVFMEYNQISLNKKEKLIKPSIDTGMGLERISAVMEGVVDNYQTFEFKNIISIIKNCLEINGVVNSASLNVIADHVRAISFLILENVLPSNEGRGYVIRRIIRRAIRHLYLISGLNKDKIVLYKIVEKFIEYKKNDEKYLYQSKNSIVDVVKKEELKFLETFENGIYLISKELENISNGGLFSGEIAFKLFDTYGFPLDLTEDILKEKNILVDKKSFIKNMEKQQEMGKKSWNKEKDNLKTIMKNLKNEATIFLGYDEINIKAKLCKIYATNDNMEMFELEKLEKNYLEKYKDLFLVFDKTVFYAESGGQISDFGFIKNDSCNNIVKIKEVIKFDNGVFYHKVNEIYDEVNQNSMLILEVDKNFRDKVSSLHTSAHILQSVLMEIFAEKQGIQQGSFINELKLRFDFSSSKEITKDMLLQIENKVNEVIAKKIDINIENKEYKKAIADKAIGLFNEKYSDIVRVVTIDKDGFFSSELCAGTHVKNTNDILMFKIVSCKNIANNVKRIEAICGVNVLEDYRVKEDIVLNLLDKFKISESEIVGKIDNILMENKNLRKKIDEQKEFYIVKNIIDKDKIINSNVESNVEKIEIEDNSLTMKNIKDVLVKIYKNYKIEKPIIIKSIDDSKNIFVGILWNKANLLTKIYDNFVTEQKIDKSKFKLLKKEDYVVTIICNKDLDSINNIDKFFI